MPERSALAGDCFAYLNLPGTGYCALSSTGQSVGGPFREVLQEVVREIHKDHREVRRIFDVETIGPLLVTGSFFPEARDDLGRHGMVLVFAMLTFSTTDRAIISESLDRLLHLRNQLVEVGVPPDISKQAVVGLLATFAGNSGGRSVPERPAPAPAAKADGEETLYREEISLLLQMFTFITSAISAAILVAIAISLYVG